MKGTTYNTTVQGVAFEYYSDFIARATFAVNLETGEKKAVSNGGYIRKDLTVRKAIARVFGFDSFRK